MPLVDRAIVLYRPGSEPRLQAFQDFAASHGIRLLPVPLADFLDNPGILLGQAGHLVVLARDRDVAAVLALAAKHGFSLGILPMQPDSVLYRYFGLPETFEACAHLALRADAAAIDLVDCNGEPVLGGLILGNAPLLSLEMGEGASNSEPWRSLRQLASGLRGLVAMRHFPVTLTTGEDGRIRTTATAVLIPVNGRQRLLTPFIPSGFPRRDGKLSTLILSPKSIGAYLLYLFSVHFFAIFSALRRRERLEARLPSALGLMRSSVLTIECSRRETYILDGHRRQAETLVVRNQARAVRVCLGAIPEAAQEATEQGRNMMKVDNLPVDGERLAMITRRLPFFTHALEREFQELFLLLKDNARLKADYVCLMVLSVLLATLGLLLDSAAVIIGAMVLAPLMAPIISLAMALLRGDWPLLQSALVTILAGLFIALVISALVALSVPMQKMSAEILSRLQPSLLDLGVAVVSGIAGGYAHAREQVMKSLPGVAIAVALVPPLCVAGIGMGWREWDMVRGASLLFLTNWVGIALAATLTFLVLGFAPVNRVATGIRGVVLSLVMVLAVSVPLHSSFTQIQRHWTIERMLSREVFLLQGKKVWLRGVRVSLGDQQVRLRAEAVSPEPLTVEDMRLLRDRLQQVWQRPVHMEVSTRLAL